MVKGVGTDQLPTWSQTAFLDLGPSPDAALQCVVAPALGSTNCRSACAAATDDETVNA